MATLLEDIKSQSEWVTKAFAADKLTLDYSVYSLLEIDRFFNKHAKNGQAVKGGRLAQNLGAILFAIGAYVGETIIRAVPGAAWETNDSDPEGEVTATVKLPDGTTMWPIQKVIKRFKYGHEDSLYVYGHYITKEITGEAFDERHWEVMKQGEAAAVAKPWWKFW